MKKLAGPTAAARDVSKKISYREILSARSPAAGG
jgi:hypothetical protein